jgi:hypothetical protein
MNNVAEALHEVVVETQETVRLLTVLQDALMSQRKLAPVIVIPTRIEVAPTLELAAANG